MLKEKKMGVTYDSTAHTKPHMDMTWPDNAKALNYPVAL